MSERSFTHLHTHTEFSMLDGAARVGELVAAAAADGQPALGITDHGNMYGVLDFYKACRDQGVVPIIGTEAYMAGESRHERPVRRGRVDDTGGDVEGGQKLYYHLTLLAETVEGYRNLMKLSSAAAAATSSPTRAAPSSMENSVWVCRCVNDRSDTGPPFATNKLTPV